MLTLIHTFHAHWMMVVVLTGVITIIHAAIARWRRTPWNAVGRALPRCYAGVTDLQMLAGIVIWATGHYWRGPLITAWVHPALMALAVALAHIAVKRTKPEQLPNQRHTAVLLFCTASMVVMIIGVAVVMSASAK